MLVIVSLWPRTAFKSWSYTMVVSKFKTACHYASLHKRTMATQIIIHYHTRSHIFQNVNILYQLICTTKSCLHEGIFEIYNIWSNISRGGMWHLASSRNSSMNAVHMYGIENKLETERSSNDNILSFVSCFKLQIAFIYILFVYFLTIFHFILVVCQKKHNIFRTTSATYTSLSCE